MKKTILAILILTSLSSLAVEFRVICSSDQGAMKDTSTITKNIAASVNSQIKLLGDRVIEVSTPNINTSTWQTNGDTLQLTCVTVKLK